MPLPLQTYVVKCFFLNNIDLNDDILYNFTNATSQLMRYPNVICWRGPQEKHPLFSEF